MKNSVALIGFMGTGKTAVGKALAERLGKEFIELDALIEKKAGKPIPEIFAQGGEIVFRELEIAATRVVAGRKNVVVACGGGIVLNRINIDRLKQECIIVYLKATPGVIWKRVSRGAAVRPLLDVDNPRLRIREMLKFRKPLYEHAADIIIDTSKLDVDSVVEEIIKRLKE
ncbi:MAG: shikimate kinase [Chloroflexota bacterium]